MDNNIGQRIKERRKSLHITQTQIQEHTSISSGNLSCIENGKYLPSAVALIELSDILDCSVDWILTGKQPFCEVVNEKETKLINLFRDLPPSDQDEIIAFINIKLDMICNRISC